MRMDNSDSDVEETQDVEAHQCCFHHEEHLESSSQSIHTQGHKRGKWLVKVKYPDGSIIETRLCMYGPDNLDGGRVILEFGPDNQPEGDSGGLFGQWLGVRASLFPFGITYEDWRKIDKFDKDHFWYHFQKKFYFDASNEMHKKFVMKCLSRRCKDAKNRLWRRFQNKTPEEAIEGWPADMSESFSKEEWQDFVKLRLSEKAKKLREQNIKSRSHYKTPHTLGTKSIARLSKEIFIETGKRPSRTEVLERRRKKAPSGFVSEEARDLREKQTEKTQNTGNRSENNTSSSMYVDFYDICGGDRPGRGSCIGLGPTPSTLTENEVNELKNRVHFLENKLEKMNETINHLVSFNSNYRRE